MYRLQKEEFSNFLWHAPCTDTNTLWAGSRDDIGDHSYGGESPPRDEPSDNGSDGYDDVGFVML